MKPTSLPGWTTVATLLLLVASNVNVNHSVAAARWMPAGSASPSTDRVSRSSTSSVQADESKTNANQDADPPISKKRRAELMSFVKKHHPELRPLLRSLEKGQPLKFQSALQSLDRDVRNLQAQEKRSPERYKKSLQLWIIKSKIRLIAAQLATNKTPQERTAMKARLRTLLNQQHNTRVSIVSGDMKQANNRVERLSKQLNELKATKAKRLEQQFKSVNRSADRILANQQKKRKSTETKKQAKSGKKPAATNQNTPRKQDDKDNSKQ